MRILLLAAATLFFANPAGIAANANETPESAWASQPAVTAVIDLSRQRIQIFQGEYPVYTWKVSTARRGYYTPTGQYKPYRMHKMWHSRKYDWSPMPYSVFFHKGWAIHGTKAIKRLGRPASHGCVRLHPKNAKTLYYLIKKTGGMKNARVVIRK